jgi:hypothetical protein
MQTETGERMRIDLFKPLEHERRLSRQDPGYLLFRQVYWTAFFAAVSSQRRTPHKASMVLPGRPGRAMEEFLLSGPAHGDPIVLH